MSPLRAVPHTREFLADTLTPLGVYQRLSRLSPWRFLFESVTGGEQVSRYSFLGAAPRAVYRLYADRLEEEDGDGRRALPGPPLEALARLVSAIRAEPGPLPFTGGFVGYFGYDLVRLVERLPDRPPDPYGLPLARLARFDRIVIFDHAHQRLVAVANEIEGQVSRAQADAELDDLAVLLEGTGESGAVALGGAGAAPAVAESLFEGAAYQAAVRQAKERITAGDIFQAVLARRWRQRCDVSPLALYRALRVINPSPYMVLLEGPEASLVGASPEMLVRVTGGRLATRPIAGTRPRGADPVEDQRLAEELLADPKERAEHVMLVDLGRNDLGRVARPGSVRVSSFMEIERYSHVMHIVSNVEAELAEGRTGLDALLACFPAGTVSGAPKIRAMEIVDSLETEARGPYAGAVGYLSFTGDLDTCITIRTLLVRDGEVSVTAGAGIVADSDPATEEGETESKAAALLAAVDLARSLAGSANALVGESARATDMILVVDNYDSFTYNLVQMFLGRDVEVEVARNDADDAAGLVGRRPSGIVLSPGPGRPEDAGVCLDLLALRPEVPVLGVCLGHQALGAAYGGIIEGAARLMHGKTSKIRHRGLGIFVGLPNPFEATRYHSLEVRQEELPSELEPVAWSDDGSLMAMRHRRRPYWGVQFHPESVLTADGPRLIDNFLALCDERPALAVAGQP